MRYTIEEFLEKINEETNLNLEEEDIYDFGGYIDSVDVGYYGAEHQSNGYFDDSYPATANLYKLSVVASELEGYYLLYEDAAGYYDGDYTIFDNLEEARNELDSLEHTELPSIEEIIKEFDTLTENKFEIEPRWENNNSGNYVSFNIYYKHCLIYDGAFISNLDDNLAKNLFETIKVFDEGLKGYTIDSIEKLSGDPSWEKYYEVRFSRGDFEDYKDIDLHHYLQGEPRNVIDVITNEIDFEELNAEYDKSVDVKTIDELKQEKQKDNAIKRRLKLKRQKSL